MTADVATRTTVVWCADWPVTAAGVDGAHEPAVVLHANRVVACSAAARAEGVTRGLRKREAQARCPDVTVLQHDPERDARTFEAVASAVEVMTPRVEIIRPGVLAFPSKGPARYFGGDDVAAELAHGHASRHGGSVGVGVADGMFAALLAARQHGNDSTVVPPGASAPFLAPLPVGRFEQARPGPELAELCDLLRRLGLRRIGDVADLPPSRLVERFGPLGTLVSRLARGLEERPPQPREVELDLVVDVELDPPAERVETAAFVARTASAELAERLERRGLTCTRLAIEVTTEHDETLVRLWRHEGGLGPVAIADRVRWQLDGWLNAADWGARPTGGIARLRLVPDQVVPDEGRQLGFWGGAKEADERAARAVARLQGLLGPDAVTVPQRRGGRGPGERVALVPAHGVRLGGGPHAADDADRPWPGHLPAPSPAVVHLDPAPVELVDGDGLPVRVSGRGLLVGVPARCGGVEVADWAGPWPCEERWWDPANARRRARLQVVLTSGAAQLLTCEAGRWRIEATYD